MNKYKRHVVYYRCAKSVIPALKIYCIYDGYIDTFKHAANLMPVYVQYLIYIPIRF